MCWSVVVSWALSLVFVEWKVEVHVKCAVPILGDISRCGAGPIARDEIVRYAQPGEILFIHGTRSSPDRICYQVVFEDGVSGWISWWPSHLKSSGWKVGLRSL